MSEIQVKYITIDLSKPCWSSRGKIDKAQELERLLLEGKNSKVTLHMEGRGTTSFFVLTMGHEYFYTAFSPTRTYFFTAHRRKHKWMVSELKLIRTINHLQRGYESVLLNQLKEKLKKGYLVNQSDEPVEIMVPVEKLPYPISKSTPLTIQSTEEHKLEEIPAKTTEPLSMIDLLLM